MKYLALLILALAQLGPVAWMIGEREHVIANGEEVKFLTRLYDPYDPFRGRYVALRFEEENFESDTDLDFPVAALIYAVLTVDDEGYARVVSLQQEVPAGDAALYLRIEGWHVNSVNQPSPVKQEDGSSPATSPEPERRYNYWLKFPFDRYYMNEKAAPEAERRFMAARRANSDEGMNRDTYLCVRILNGKAVSSALYIEGKPVEQLLGEAK